MSTDFYIYKKTITSFAKIILHEHSLWCNRSRTTTTNANFFPSCALLLFSLSSKGRRGYEQGKKDVTRGEKTVAISTLSKGQSVGYRQMVSKRENTQEQKRRNKRQSVMICTLASNLAIYHLSLFPQTMRYYVLGDDVATKDRNISPSFVVVALFAFVSAVLSAQPASRNTRCWFC